MGVASNAVSYQQLKTIETQKTDKTGEQASRVAPSTADLKLLQALAAKIKTRTGTASAKPPAALAPRGEAARIPASSITAASNSSEGTAPTSRIPGITPNVLQSMRAPAASLSLGRTQTLRPLTPLELADGEASRWFVIQLMLSANQIVDAEVPCLDIFAEYRLYSVTGPEQGRLMHALRLGFFSSEVAAKAVAHYLLAYFPASTIRRVSIAERERFADKLVTAGKDIGASGKHAVIELVGAQAPLPEARIATAPAEGGKPPARVASSLWSRLRSRIVGLARELMADFMH